MPPFPPPSLSSTPPAPRPGAPIPPRKLILGVILVCSIFLFFLILFAAFIAILREAAPTHHLGLASSLVAARHNIFHHILHIARHR